MYELYLRWKEPLNTFWHRAQMIFGLLASCALTVTELLPIMANDSLVPEEWKTTIRIVYSVALGITIAARFTVRDPQQLKHKKEFHEKIDQ